MDQNGERKKQTNVTLDQEGIRSEKLSQLKRSRGACKGSVTRKENEILELMNDYENLDVVRERMTKLDESEQNFRSAHDKYHSMLDNEPDEQESKEYYASVERRIHDLKQRIEEWSQKAESIQRASADWFDIRPEDSASNVGSRNRRSKGFKSSSVTSSRISGSSSVISARATAAARKAALTAEAATLHKHQALQQAELRLKQEELRQQQQQQEEAKLHLLQRKQELDLETEIAKAEAEEHAYAMAESSERHHQLSSGAQRVYNPLPSRPQREHLTDPVFTADRNQSREVMPTNTRAPSRETQQALRTLHAAPEVTLQRVEVHAKGAQALMDPEQENRVPLVARQSLANHSTLNPSADEYCSPERHSSQENNRRELSEASDGHPSLSEDVLQHVMDLKRQQQQQLTLALTLPQAEVPTFGGDPIEYCDFVRSFENLIEAKTTSSRAILYYLVQYTSGDVRELMRSCLSMSPDEGYLEARKLLKSRYGQAYKIATAYVDRLTKGPPIGAEDGAGLQRFSILLTSCKNTLKEIGYLNKIENPDSLQRVVERLPFALRKNWRDNADNISNVREREITIGDIANFVEVKARASTHPTFGNITSESKTKSYKDPGKPRTKFGAITSRASAFVTRGNAETATDGASLNSRVSHTASRIYDPKCPMCNGDHWLSQCEGFKKSPAEQRLGFVRKVSAITASLLDTWPSRA